MKKLKLTLTILFGLFFLVDSYSQDWSNLQRYQNQNNELLKRETDEGHEGRIVFMGDSITEFWLTIHPDFFVGKPYINRGISGQTTPQMLLRFRQDVINLKPSVVVLLAGINDIAGNTGPSTIEMIENNIVSMIELAKSNHIKVVLCSVLPAFRFPWAPEKEPAELVMKLNEKLKANAKKYNSVYVDYFSEMGNKQNGLKEELGNDGVHPNAAGYLIMESILNAQLKKVI